MSKVMEKEFKRWTVERKAALAMEIIRGKTTVAGATYSVCWPKQMIETIRKGLKRDDFGEALSKICLWFDIPRRTAFYKPAETALKMQERFAEPIKKMISEKSSLRYRAVAALLDFNKNTAQKTLPFKGWQVKKLLIDLQQRVKALPPMSMARYLRWMTVLCRHWAERDGGIKQCSRW